ncbi:MAG: hypothetical protein ACRDZ5_00250 [Acidimicrobiales bacterium]
MLVLEAVVAAAARGDAVLENLGDWAFLSEAGLHVPGAFLR